jgi:site-specific recombinase XerD
VFEATGINLDDLGEEHGHRVVRVRGKGGKVVLVPLSPAVSRAIERAAGARTTGPLLLNQRGVRMDRHAATRRLHHLADAAGVNLPRMHPHMLRHTYVTTMLDAGVDLRDVQIAARHADPRTTMRYDRARQEPRPTPQLHPRRLHGRRNLNFGLGGERLPYCVGGGGARGDHHKQPHAREAHPRSSLVAHRTARLPDRTSA